MIAEQRRDLTVDFVGGKLLSMMKMECFQECYVGVSVMRKAQLEYLLVLEFFVT